MAGLLATQLAKDPLKTVSGYDPEKIAVEAKDTAAGQLDTMLDSGSKLMQSANTRGKQYGNRRGLLNSTMAGQAAEQAMIDSATPIATHDASTNYDAKKSNQSAGNAALQFTAGQKNAAESQLADQGFRGSENEKDRTLQSDLQRKDQQFQAGENALTRTHQSTLQAGEQAWRTGEAALDRSQQLNVQNLEAQYNLLYQNDQQAFQASQNALDRELEGMRLDVSQKNAIVQSQMAAINAVLMDPNLEPAAKRIAIENIQGNTRETAAFMETLNTSATRTAAPATTGAPAATDPLPALTNESPVAQQVARGAINAIREREQATGTQGAEQRALKDMKAHLDAIGVDTSDAKAVAAALGISEEVARKNLDKLK